MIYMRQPLNIESYIEAIWSDPIKIRQAIAINLLLHNKIDYISELQSAVDNDYKSLSILFCDDTFS